MFNADLHLFWVPDFMGHMIPTLRSPHVKMLLLVTLVSGMTTAAPTSAQTGEPPLSEAYFVQQGVDEALLIRINAFEAEFESRISTQDGVPLLQSGIPGSRIAPVFQYIHASKKERQLDIEVTSTLHTNRSKFGLALTRLEVWDDRSGSVSRAYQLLSYGLQATNHDSAANWTIRIDYLLNAGKLFQKFGMKEMRLWSQYLAAHMILFRLHDYSIVYTMSREILAELKGSRLHKIELATLQLQSAALIGLKRSGSLPVTDSNPHPVQKVLARTAALAASMGYGFEQARALNTSGAEYASEAFYFKALEQFQLAVAIADSVGDKGLTTGIRESIVQIHAIQGDLSASGEVLRDIETQLTKAGDEDELALNLLAQGRLYIGSYRYKQAIDVLSQALEYQNDSAIRRQVNFELAKINYATGYLERSEAYLQLAQVSPALGRQKRISSVIDMGEGLRILANIHRAMAEYPQMRAARNAQGQYRPIRAQYLYEQGLDEIAAARKNRQQARSLFLQSHKAAIASENFDFQHLSRLQFCALGGRADALCSKTGIRTAYEWLATGGVPVFSLEAMFLWAKILVNSDRQTEAITVLGRLVDEIHLFRHSLPGVLGAWYRERHENMFEYYLDLLKDVDGAVSLLALSKIRYIEKYTYGDPVSSEGSGDTDLLRVQLAQRANSVNGQVLSDLKISINDSLDEIRKSFRHQLGFLSNSGLKKYLRSLNSDETVLTYHISPTSAQVWVGHEGKIQHRNIANPAYLYGALQEARQGLSDIGISSFENKMDALGQRLIIPVADLLTKKIYWIPSGSLLGFPLDALRVKNQYLVEQHTVTNLLSFPANRNPVASLQPGSVQKVFLAGHPRDYSGDYATRLDTSAEISTIADIFVGPGLSIVQGAALLPDEFQDKRFKQANLVHLSMPGIIDLEYPEQSSLELSGAEYSGGRVLFTSKDVRSKQLAARLVFLSATRVKNTAPSGFSSQPGLVSDFADAGAQSVIANLWAGSGKPGDALVTDFYAKLEGSGDIAESLKDAKNRYIRNNRKNGLYDWAGYQLFID